MKRPKRVYLKIDPTTAVFILDTDRLDPSYQAALSTIPDQIRAAVGPSIQFTTDNLLLIIKNYQELYNLDLTEAIISLATQEYGLLLTKKISEAQLK